MELQPWQEYFVKQAKVKPFVSVAPVIDNADLIAHISIEEFIKYYCYTGNAKFWTILSMLIKPKVIVEFGTAMGIRTKLFARLNPEAVVYSIDINPVAGTADAVSGHVAQHEENVKLYIGNSSELAIENVDLCYIDANHASDCVLKDSWRAWANKNKDSSWAIVWDDYQLQSVRDSVHDFIKIVGYRLVQYGGVCLTASEETLKLLTGSDKRMVLTNEKWMDKQEIIGEI